MGGSRELLAVPYHRLVAWFQLTSTVSTNPLVVVD
jgi:hypothetical protein